MRRAPAAPTAGTRTLLIRRGITVARITRPDAQIALIEEGRLRALLERACEMVGIVDRVGRIVYQSSSTERVLGHAPLAMIGHSAADYVHPNDEAAMRSVFERVSARAGASELATARLRHADGTWRTCVVAVTNLLHDPAVNGIVLNTQDISRLKEALDQAERARVRAEIAAERMTRLQRVTAALSSAGPHDDVLDVIIGQAVEAMGAFAGAVLELSEDGGGFILRRHVGLDAAIVEAYTRYSTTGDLPVGEVYRTHRAVFLSSPMEWTGRFGCSATVDGVAACEGAWASLPLIVRDHLIGVLTLSFRKSRPFDEADREFMQALGNQCAQALERAKLFDAERTARRDAEGASEAKSQFLAVMSHELRTPLTGIIGYADLLANEVIGPLSEPQRTHLGRIQAGAWHLVGIIDEILTFARLEAGREQVFAHPIELCAIAQQAIEMVQPVAQQKGLTVTLVGDAHSLYLRSDGGKIRQVLLNLIGNAVKFTDHGEIEVHVTVTGDHARVGVRDTGPGISADRMNRIFEPFTQGDSSTTRSKGGTGLGLTVSRRLAKLLGGELLVESTAGAGSTFTLVLPHHGDA
jgi:hypothetical protein